MKRRVVLIGMVVAVVALLITLVPRDPSDEPAGKSTNARADSAIAIYRAGLDRLDTALMRLEATVEDSGADASRAAFRDARAAYKRVELFTEYYGPFLVRELNGVPIPQAEQEDPETPLAPVGFQVIEAELFPDVRSESIAQIRQLLGYMRTAVGSLRAAGADTMPGDAYVFDAMRHEIARVSTLGIAGFDATVSKEGVREATHSLEGIRDALGPYRDDLLRRNRIALDTFDMRLDAAIAYLGANPDHERLDRLAFLAHHAIPTAHALLAAQQALGIGPPDKPRAWSHRAASIFDENAIDPMFFSAVDAPRLTPELIALGRDLFFDPQLSPSGGRSCASCHHPERAFTDGRTRAEFLAGHGRKSAIRNTPTLVNAALQPTLFADNRFLALEDQVTDVLGAPGEMGGSLHGAADTLRRRRAYHDRFTRVFPVERDSAISARTLRLALAAYVRSLIALSSPFDKAVRGDTAALSVAERDGFRVFMGKAQCGTCHFAPLFNGATPPSLYDAEPEVIGVPASAGKHRAVIDPDSGRFNIRRIDQHLHSFKTPTLRNVALTAPYMHNGVFETLEEVVDFYDGGGGAGLGIELAHQTLPADSLRLTRGEKQALLAFLKSLTDTAGTKGMPVRSARTPP